MLRSKHLIATAAVLVLGATPAFAGTSAGPGAPTTEKVAPPPSSIAAGEGQGYGELRSVQPSQDLRSPDAVDAAGHRGFYAGEDRSPYVLSRDYGSPDAVDAARDLPPVDLPEPVVPVADAPSGGFDWGDAGIGAAGMVALFSIAAGGALLMTSRRRRRGFSVAH